MKLPSVESVLNDCPLNGELRILKQNFDVRLKENFTNRRKLTVICGPCSADEPKSVNEYLRKLGEIQHLYPHLLIVARVYSSKPHSNGQGYMGTCFHKEVDDVIDLPQGIIRARKMMIDCLTSGLPVADELLYTDLYHYFADLVSYWFVGARSSEDTAHRAFASGLDLCCGVKNTTDGDVYKAVDSVFSVSNPSVFPYKGVQIATDGCKYAHIVLRGGKTGDNFTSNLTHDYTRFAKQRLDSFGLNDFVMVDLSHANSGKVADNQIENAKTAAVNRDVDGVMLESYLFGGVQCGAYGVSKTDDCLCFDDTVKVLKILEDGFASRKCK